MLRLTADHYKTLLHLKRSADGWAFLALLRAAPEETNVALRTATGEGVGWLQGEAQCLVGWLERVEEAERLGGSAASGRRTE